MMIINIAAVAVAIAVVALVIVLVPLIRELRLTAAALRETVTRLETDIHPAIVQLNETLADLNVISSGVAEKVDDVKEFMDAVGETGKGVRTISGIVGNVAMALSKSSLWFTGAKVAGSFIADRFIKKRR